MRRIFLPRPPVHHHIAVATPRIIILSLSCFVLASATRRLVLCAEKKVLQRCWMRSVGFEKFSSHQFLLGNNRLYAICGAYKLGFGHERPFCVIRKLKLLLWNCWCVRPSIVHPLIFFRRSDDHSFVLHLCTVAALRSLFLFAMHVAE